MKAFFLSLGAIGVLLYFLILGAIGCAVVYTWFTGVMFGFSKGIIIGLVSILPPVGFIEGILVLLGVLT